MNYHFCNLNFYLNEFPVSPDERYTDFRKKHETAESDSITEVEIVDRLLFPEKEPVFSSIHGLSVILEKEREYRCFYDLFSGKNKSLLIDEHDTGKRTLYISKQMIEQGRYTELDLLNGIAWEKAMSEHGRFMLHASFVETAKGAILLTAPSETGKSTQAELWRVHRGCEVINGDRAGIWNENGTWMAGGVPWCGTSEIMKNKCMPLRAIVILRQGPTNEIQEMHTLKKTRNILEQLTVNPWNYQQLQQAQMFCMQLCAEIPVLLLSCTPEEEAVRVLEETLEKLS